MAPQHARKDHLPSLKDISHYFCTGSTQGFTAQPYESAFVTAVVVALVASTALVIPDDWLNRNFLANPKTLDTRSDFLHYSTELMPKGEGNGHPCDWVWTPMRTEVRAAEILVQVCAANTTKYRLDLVHDQHLTVRFNVFRDNFDLTRPARWDIDILETNVFFAMVHNCFHPP